MRRRFRAIAIVLLTTVAVAPVNAQVPLPAAVQVIGSVTNAAKPVASALIIALNLTDFRTTQTYSGADGSFTLPALSSGLYKVIAVKQGFAPAIATLLPTRPSHRLRLNLHSEKRVSARSVNQELWEIRGSLPPDILRELDAVLATPQTVTVAPRFRGEMVSLTGLADQSPAFAQTALGVKSRFGETLEIGIRGNLHRIEDPNDDQRFGDPLAESSVMSMEVSPSESNIYRVASVKSYWRYREPSQTADVRAHNFEWQHGDARVQLRYFGHQNLFAFNRAGSETFEIGGNTTLIQTARSDVGLSVRVTQENLRNAPAGPTRTADLTATGSLEFVPSLVVHYGVSSRLARTGTSWVPRGGAEWKVGANTSFVASGMYKVDPRAAENMLPVIVAGADESRVLPRYSYSVGFVSGDETPNRVSAIATITAVDAPLRVLFADGFEQFWDGLYIDAGDVRKDLRLAYRREVGGKVAIDVSTSAGTATPTRTPNAAQKVYVTGDVQSIFLPTGTTLAISYHALRQPQVTADYRSRRMNVRMAQPLHLPLDLTLLLGLEVARAENSPLLLDLLESDGTARKYIGGLAVNF